ncbi:MAG TPA: alpha/beta fold hydrolase [Casimicrobiaceae bacterium]
MLVTAFALLACACATPSRQFAAEAHALGFASAVIEGDPFRHAVWFAQVDERSDALHVYIEHDGTPWIDVTRVSGDPTPRTPFALELMARDTGPRLFLGRPCYFEMRFDAACSPSSWTHRRYAPEVVHSMASALRAFLEQHPYRHVVLIGYSGGGTLAWLLASRVPQTSAVVTIAANLDTDAWTTLHRYSTMTGSLNPALQPPLPSSIIDVAYVGGRDDNVPPSIARSFAARHRNAKIVEVAGFDHRCCWIERWPRLLESAIASH